MTANVNSEVRSGQRRVAQAVGWVPGSLKLWMLMKTGTFLDRLIIGFGKQMPEKQGMDLYDSGLVQDKLFFL